jgi:ERCC4-type nuclease
VKKKIIKKSDKKSNLKKTFKVYYIHFVLYFAFVLLLYFTLLCFMIFEIDNREPSIIKEHFVNSKFKCNYKNLEQGDFIIRNSDSNENIILLFERKTIDDLLASVKDSRYSEQCERYSQLGIPNNKIYYIIEGNLDNLIKDSIEYKTVYSCIFSLSFKKEFSILLSDNIQHTITILDEFLLRIDKDNDKDKVYSTNKLIKKQTITKENIDSYMLNLVPGIGINTAKVILTCFDGKLYNLIYQLKTNYESVNEILSKITINSRKLSKKIIQSIKDYFY